MEDTIGTGGAGTEPVKIEGVEISRDRERCARCVVFLERKYDEGFYRYVRREYAEVLFENKDLGERFEDIDRSFFTRVVDRAERSLKDQWRSGDEDYWDRYVTQIGDRFEDLLREDEKCREKLERLRSGVLDMLGRSEGGVEL
jgi:hypothetical protein